MIHMIDKNSQSYKTWPNFYDHPFIQSIAEAERWSISQTTNKMPIDMFNIAHGKLTGCVPDTPHSMTTLGKTVEIMESVYNQMPSNHAFNMDTNEDNFILLDIEPACPPHIVRKFLQLPYIYAEKSLSGKGIHMVMPVLPEYWQYPAVLKLQKMQEEHRYYEIIFNHWVTFTRNMLKPSNPKADDSFYHEIFKELAEKQVEKTTEDLEFEMDDNHDIEVSDIPGADEIIAYATNGANEYKRTLKDYNDDVSTFVFGVSGHFYNVMSKLMKISSIKKLNHEYTPQERTRILYAIVKDRVPDRPKNHERRGNTTWLMAQCQSIVGNRLGQEKANKHT
jgi:hypothetical protein